MAAGRGHNPSCKPVAGNLTPSKVDLRGGAAAVPLHFCTGHSVENCAQLLSVPIWGCATRGCTDVLYASRPP